MSAPITGEKRQEIITAIKGGLPVPEASTTYQVTVPTIRKWMRQGSSNSHTSSSELVKARKEIEFLRSVVLDLVLEQKAQTRKG